MCQKTKDMTHLREKAKCLKLEENQVILKIKI